MAQGHDTQVPDEQFISDLIDELGGVATLPEVRTSFSRLLNECGPNVTHLWRDILGSG